MAIDYAIYAVSTGLSLWLMMVGLAAIISASNPQPMYHNPFGEPKDE